jgi:diguanylate cyclase
MDYGHTVEQASEFAKAATEMMARRQIPADPNNFTVWYSYFSGVDADLRRVLDILLDNDQEFSSERNAAVFRKFCSSPYEAIPMHLIADRMETELAAVLSTLAQASSDADSYGKALQDVAGQFKALTRAEDIIHMLQAMLAQTRAMAKQSRDVEGQLRQSWSEVNQLREELEGARREAMTDSLTGLANRKMFDFVLREAAMHAMESGEPISMLFLDIDHFKAFNDTYGHNVGDQVLKLLASVLRESVKGQDTAARYGGEEFAVILPATPVDAAAKVAEKIRQRVAGKTIVHRRSGDQLGRVQVSIGVSEFVFGEPIRQFVDRADRALYAAKRQGRNRVVVEVSREQNRVAFGG